MAERIELQAQLRENKGTGASRRLRRIEDLMPAVLYGAHEAPQHISFDHDKIIKSSAHEAFYSSILTIDIDRKSVV